MAASPFANQISFWQAQSAAEEGGASSGIFGAVTVNSMASGANVAAPEESASQDLERAFDFAFTLLRRENGGSLGCWTPICPASRWVAAVSVSRGLQWGWTARWMVHRAPQQIDPAPPTFIRIEQLHAAPAKRAEVPYADEQWVTHLSKDPTTIVLGAFDQDLMVGTVSLHLNSAAASAGIFNLGVAESHQRRGIGRSLMQHALAEGARRGVREVTVNATDAGAPLYDALGFKDAGRGQTWWVTPEMSSQPKPPTLQREVAYAIAMNLPDIPATSDHILPCNLTPMRLAATTDSPVAARALQEKGIKLDCLSAWDLGWKSEARDAARDSIDLVDQVEKATLLHTAIRRGDRELAQLCLQLGARTDIKDPTYGSDALGWCEACGQPEIRDMIKQSNASNA